MAEPNVRLSGMKQELSVFKSEFSSSFEKLKDSIILNFLILMLDWMKSKKTKKSVTEEVNVRISIKNRIIDTVKEKNLKLQNKVKKLEEQLLETDQKNNHLDQYSRRNNLEIQGIPANITDDKLEGKIIDIFSCLGIEVKG